MFRRAKEQMYLTEQLESKPGIIRIFKPAYSVGPGDVVLQLPSVTSWEMTGTEAAELGRALKDLGHRAKTKNSKPGQYQIARSVSVSNVGREVLLLIGDSSYHLSGLRAYDIGCQLLEEVD